MTSPQISRALGTICADSITNLIGPGISVPDFHSDCVGQHAALCSSSPHTSSTTALPTTRGSLRRLCHQAQCHRHWENSGTRTICRWPSSVGRALIENSSNTITTWSPSKCRLLCAYTNLIVMNLVFESLSSKNHIFWNSIRSQGRVCLYKRSAKMLEKPCLGRNTRTAANLRRRALPQDGPRDCYYGLSACGAQSTFPHQKLWVVQRASQTRRKRAYLKNSSWAFVIPGSRYKTIYPGLVVLFNDSRLIVQSVVCAPPIAYRELIISCPIVPGAG